MPVAGVAPRLGGDRRLGRAAEAAEEAVRTMQAEVVGARVGQRGPKLVTGADRVAVRRAGNRQRASLEVDAERAVVIDRERQLAGYGGERDVEAVAEPARGTHARLLGRDGAHRWGRRRVGRLRLPGRLICGGV